MWSPVAKALCEALQAALSRVHQPPVLAGAAERSAWVAKPDGEVADAPREHEPTSQVGQQHAHHSSVPTMAEFPPQQGAHHGDVPTTTVSPPQQRAHHGCKSKHPTKGNNEDARQPTTLSGQAVSSHCCNTASLGLHLQGGLQKHVFRLQNWVCSAHWKQGCLFSSWSATRPGDWVLSPATAAPVKGNQ